MSSDRSRSPLLPALTFDGRKGWFADSRIELAPPSAPQAAGPPVRRGPLFAASSLGPCRRTRDSYASPAGEGVRWREDHLVGRLKPGQDLDGLAIVAPDRHGNELRPAIPDHPYL